jgi:hypothetical protein
MQTLIDADAFLRYSQDCEARLNGYGYPAFAACQMAADINTFKAFREGKTTRAYVDEMLKADGWEIRETVVEAS